MAPYARNAEMEKVHFKHFNIVKKLNVFRQFGSVTTFLYQTIKETIPTLEYFISSNFDHHHKKLDEIFFQNQWFHSFIIISYKLQTLSSLVLTLDAQVALIPCHETSPRVP